MTQGSTPLTPPPSDSVAPIEPATEIIGNDIPSDTTSGGVAVAKENANGGMKRFLKRLLKISFILFLLSAIFLVLCRFVIWPLAAHAKDTLTSQISQKLDRTFQIQNLDTYWDGFYPAFRADGITLKDSQGKEGLNIAHVDGSLSWRSLFFFDLYLHNFDAKQLQLLVERDTQGKVSLATMPMGNKPDDGSSLDWLLKQKSIHLSDGKIVWQDALTVDATTKVTRPISTTATITDFAMENVGREHAMSLQANIPDISVKPIQISTQFNHDRFEKPHLWKFWQGQLKWSIPTAKLVPLHALFPISEQVISGTLQSDGNINFAKGQITQAFLSFLLQDANLKFGKAKLPLRVYSLQGNIDQLLEADKHTLQVHQLAWRLTSTANEQSIKELKLAWRPDKNAVDLTSMPRWVSLETSNLDLDILNKLAQALPLPTKITNTLAAYAPRGKLENVKAEWEPDLYKSANAAQIASGAQTPTSKTHDHFRAEMFLRNVSINAQGLSSAQKKRGELGSPGFSNLSGKLHLTQEKGNLVLNSTQSKLEFPGLFEEPIIPFNYLRGTINWKRNKGQWEVSSDRFAFQNPDISADNKFRYLSAEKGPGFLDLDTTIPQAQIPRIPRYLPSHLSASLRQYLLEAMKAGIARNAKVSLHGDLAHFPFHKPQGGKTSGIFHIDIPVQGVVYSPLGNKNHDWPNLEQGEGVVSFDKGSLQFNFKQANTAGITLQNVQGKIEDMAAHDAQLKISGTAENETQKFLRYIDQTPISGWIANFTKDTRAQGSGKLNLQLTLPLTQKTKTQVQGSYTFLNNEVRLIPSLPIIKQLNGNLQFSEKGLQLQKIRGQFLGGETQVEGGTQMDGSTRLNVYGLATVEGLKDSYKESAIERIAMRLSGSTKYETLINVNHGSAEIVTQTDLQGLGIDLPYPLQKSVETSVPSKFEWRTAKANAVDLQSQTENELPSATNTEKTSLEDIIVQYGTILNAHYVQQHNPAISGPRVNVLRGGIGINRPAPNPESGVLANVEVDKLDIDAWRSTLNQMTGKKEVVSPVNNFNQTNLNTLALTSLSTVETKNDAALLAQAASEEATPKAENTTNTAELVSHYLPTQIAAHAQEVVVFGRHVENVVMGASREDKTWQANIDSPQISGYLQWAPQGENTPFGKLTAHLARLNIPHRDVEVFTHVLEDKAQEIPGFDIQADSFTFEEKPLGALSIKAHSISSLYGAEWELDNLTLSNPGGTLTASGNWRLRKTIAETLTGKSTTQVDTFAPELLLGSLNAQDIVRKNTSLNFDLKIDDAGKLLDILGIPKTLENGAGNITGKIGWLGSPFDLTTEALSGKISMDVRNGQFLKVDPGAAKLLGVLSFQGLTSIATFDFRGLFGAGTPFDTVTASATMEKGVLTTKDFVMRSSQALVSMSGDINLPKETQNLRLTVLPNVSAASASLAMIAVNPVIGLGTLAAQFLLKDQISQALKTEYEINGSWSKPKVTKVSRFH